MKKYNSRLQEGKEETGRYI